MGKHDEIGHYLNIPKQLKFEQMKPATRQDVSSVGKAQKLGVLHRRG